MKVELRHRVVRVILTAVIFALFGAMFMPFFTPLLMAALFGFALDGVVSRYAPKRSTRRMPTALILLGFFTLVSLPVVVVSVRVVSIARELAATQLEETAVYKSVEHLVASVSVFADRLFEAVGATPPEGGLMNVLPKAGAWVLAYIAGFAATAPELILHLFVFSAALYVFLTESRYIRTVVSSFKILKESELAQILRVVQRSSYMTLVVSACLGAIQATIVALGGLIFGFKDFFFIFIVTFFCSFVPVIGAAPMAVLLSLIAFVQGNTFEGVGLVVVAVIAGSVDNVIKPLVVSSNSEESLNPIISLLAIIGAVIVYGLPGLLLGPILMELTLKIVPILFSEDEAEAEEIEAVVEKGS